MYAAMAVATTGGTFTGRVLHHSDFYELELFRAERVVLLRRTHKPFPSFAELRTENERVVATFARSGAAAIVVDMRAAPPNNDRQFEDAMSALRTAVGKAFRRVVVVVQSASGEMQVTRLHRSEGARYFVTRDYAQALQLALEQGG
jgi:hypothetical protein